MNTNDMDFYHLTLVYANVALAIALTILSITLPKIIKESRVQDGLIGFRKLLLVSGGTIFLLIIVALLLLNIRSLFRLEEEMWISWLLLCILSTIILVNAFAKYRIYTFNFSATSKAHHKTLENREKKAIITERNLTKKNKIASEIDKLKKKK